MMPALLHHILLLLTAVTIMLSDSEARIQKVCTGDSVLLFQINNYDRCDIGLEIRVLQEEDSTTNSYIATWLHNNCSQFATLAPIYKGRLFLHENGSIMIHNVSSQDNKRYFVVSNNPDAFHLDNHEHEVKLVIMVPPSKDCKPNISITGRGEVLTVRLKPEDCGSTNATPYWESCINIPQTDASKLNISCANINRVFKACIKGDDLECVKNKSELENYCSVFHANESSLFSKYIEEQQNRHKDECLQTFCSSLTWNEIMNQLKSSQIQDLHTYCSSVFMELKQYEFDYQRRGLESLFNSFFMKQKQLFDYQRQGLESFFKASQENDSRVISFLIGITILGAIMTVVVIWILLMIIKINSCWKNTDQTRRRPRL